MLETGEKSNLKLYVIFMHLNLTKYHSTVENADLLSDGMIHDIRCSCISPYMFVFSMNTTLLTLVHKYFIAIMQLGRHKRSTASRRFKRPTAWRCASRLSRGQFGVGEDPSRRTPIPRSLQSFAAFRPDENSDL